MSKISMNMRAKVRMVELTKSTIIEDALKMFEINKVSELPGVLNELYELTKAKGLPVRIVVKGDFIDKRVVNLLGYMYAAGVEITINNIVFREPNPGDILRYNWIESLGVTEQFKNYMKTDEFTYEDLNAFNQRAIKQVNDNQAKLWDKVRDFFRLVQTIDWGGKVVMQPNKKIYKEETRDMWLYKQLINLLPLTKATREHVKLTRKYVGFNDLLVKIDYEASKDVLQAMAITEDQQLELDSERNVYMLDDDNLYYIDRNVKTEHGIAERIRYIYEAQTKVYFNTENDEFDGPETTGAKLVELYTHPIKSEAKAFVNYNILQYLKDNGLNDERYVKCDNCGKYTLKEHLYCDVCNTQRQAAVLELEDIKEDVFEEAINIIRRNNASMEILGYRRDELLKEVTIRSPFTDVEYVNGELQKVEEQEPISWEVLKSL